MKPNAIITYIIIAINCIVFLIETLLWWSTNLSVAYNFWAHYTPVMAAEPRRFITAMFLHFWIIHLFLNMLALHNIWPLIETLLWKRKYLLIYLVSGLSWNLAVFFWESYTWNYSLSAGASGAIFWILWAILAIVIMLKQQSKNVNVRGVVLSILYSLAPWFIISWISLTAHIGGLIWGFIITNILLLINKKNQQSQEN